MGHDKTLTFISQNILAHSRNLVEHIAIRAFSQGKEIEICKDTNLKSIAFLKTNNKYLFLREFHEFLQISKSHYTPTNEGAERLMIKYYPYFVMIKNFVKQEYNLDILRNLEKFPINTDKTIEQFHKKISEKIIECSNIWDGLQQERLYIQKIIPFIVNNESFYEIVLSPVFDTTSKFDHFTVYSKTMIRTKYAIKATIVSENIIIEGKKMPIYILSNYTISIRPCELNNFAKIFNINIDMSSNSSEYIGMMNYLTKSGASLLDIILSSESDYSNIKKTMFEKCKKTHFEQVLDEARKLILSNRPGSNVIRYLIHTLHNRTIKKQKKDNKNDLLSNLKLEFGCIPFDRMPFVTSLIQHNPETKDLFECIEYENREHELMAKSILNKMISEDKLYIPIKELPYKKIDTYISIFNNLVYPKHIGRKLEKFGDNIYVKEAFENTKEIISKLCEKTDTGLTGYSNAISTWINEIQIIDSKEKTIILKNLFDKTHIALLYGAAGTGKTYLINKLSQFLDSSTKLYLANTNPAVENLRRKINTQNGRFMTIFQYLNSKNAPKDIDILIIDECSMVSNSDMVKILRKANYKIMLLVGDIYQINSIEFGNWFYMAKYFLPKYTYNELTTPFRTNDKNLLELWKKVRNLDKDLTEYIVSNEYSSNIGLSLFDRKTEDEIILCLNYDGLYGINNINRFMQENNTNISIRWGLWTYKIGDPILFNETERFAPVLYNNLKGRIIDIEKENDERIWFTLEVDKALNELDLSNLEIDLLDYEKKGKSKIRFFVLKKNNTDNDESNMDDKSIIPFQIAYAVSIHKAQGLEYDSVKVIITEEVDRMITHNIFYTAITRSKKFLTIYWSPETQNKVISDLRKIDHNRDKSIFASQTNMKSIKKFD